MKSFKDWMSENNKVCWSGYERVPGTKKYEKDSCRKKTVKESNEFDFEVFMEAKDKKKKPYKNYDPEKNHPEGGLKPSVAKKMGIHAGVETKREVEKKGGVKNLSDKTAARRKSFCARMKGMKKKLTSKETANDPNSKINASLRVWKC